ncbi:hypothetical protein EZV62_004789 [Acer yangbiense]|uniref:Reverse transcriptase Ty1/copia-type domain-containing protein n=1 Tax=Acer yangbiense TaxID=1000413 RepID=A0A5C7ILX9_9ROSI|nr:hypothetical protein EZV62_004789 [Acer yangbiense]
MQLSKEFDMKDLGAAQKILGMQIRRDKVAGKIWLSQAKYIQYILERFNMNEAKPMTTPLAAHYRLSALQCPTTEKELEKMSKVSYVSIVGCLMYVMVCKRPNLTQALSVVSRYMANPGMEHWSAVKWIKSLGILLEKQGKETCVLSYVDADYAGDLDKRSTTSYVFTSGGKLISWRATLQSITALSTTETEYIALTEAGKEAVWLNGLAREFRITQGSMVIRCDNQSAIYLVKNQVFHGRSEHNEARYHRIRDWVESKVVTLEKVHTEKNASDYLTKPVTAEKFKFCLNSLNLITC